jgi:hypothetical protein
MKKLVMILGLTLVLGGCATGARMSAMTVSVKEETIIGSESVLHHAIEIAEVSGGEETNPLWISKVSNQEFRKALENSLSVHTMLFEGDTSKFKLLAMLTKLDQPMWGGDLTVTAIVKYMLTDTEKDLVVFDQLIEAPYTASFGDALLAYERIRLANEGAIRMNIGIFIQKLIDEAMADPAFGGVE